MTPDLQVLHSTPGSHNGLVLLTVGRNTRAIHKESEFEAVIAVNGRGEVVWQRQFDFLLMDCRQSKCGTLLLMGGGGIAEEVDLDGKTINRWYCPDRFPDGDHGKPLDTMKIHHAISELSDGLLATVSICHHERDAPEADWTHLMSDTVVLFDRDGRIHSEIDLFDVLDTNRITADSYLPYWRLQGWDKTLDWSHANCIVEDPNDGGLLLSLRHQDAVIKITRAGELVWILGNPGGWQGQWKDKLLTIDGGEPFYHQHDLSITTRGELMLFNNGANPDQPIETRESFVLCYQIDEKAMTATETWRFGGQSIPYSHYVSGACELNNGNIFVACTGLTHDLDGNRVAIPPKGVGAIEVFEVTRDGESIMHARLEKKGAQPNAGWNGFRPEFLTAEVAMQLGQK